MSDKVRGGVLLVPLSLAHGTCDSSSISMKLICGGESSPEKNELTCDISTGVSALPVCVYFHRSPCFRSIFPPMSRAVANEALDCVHVERLMSILSMSVTINQAF